MKILLLNAHPDYQNPDRTINRLAHQARTTIQRQRPDADVTELDLYDPQVTLPRITADVMNNPASVQPIQQQLIDQFKAADLILIMMPLHNFNVVSKLKDYIDNVFIANQTFKYTADGSVGLLDGHQKVVYVQSSGSDYEHDIRYVAADIAPYYLRTILNFMGLTKMTLIRAEALDIAGNDREAIIEQTSRELTDYLERNL